MAEAIDDRKKLLEDPSISNAQKAALWPIDVNQDPYAMPLDDVEPRASGIVRGRQAWAVFRTITARRSGALHARRASSVRIGRSRSSATSCMSTRITRSSRRNSQRRHQRSAADRWPKVNPDPTYDLPMFIMSDPPKHDHAARCGCTDVPAASDRGARIADPRTRWQDPRQPAAQRRVQLGATRVGGTDRPDAGDAVRHPSGRPSEADLLVRRDVEPRQSGVLRHGGGRLQSAVGVRRVFHGAVRNSARTSRRSRISYRCSRTASRRRTCRRTNSSATSCC